MSKIKAFGEGEWVSEKTKELDKLGGVLRAVNASAQPRPILCRAQLVVSATGKNRPPVKRGDSLKMKLQWLQVTPLLALFSASDPIQAQLTG